MMTHPLSVKRYTGPSLVRISRSRSISYLTALALLEFLSDQSELSSFPQDQQTDENDQLFRESV